MAERAAVMDAVDAYLAVRRAAGFGLHDHEYVLRSFVRFAAARGESHVRTAAAIEWASLGPSPGRRHTCLGVVVGFARHVHAEDERHEVPPRGFFGYRKKRRVPFVYTKRDVEKLVAAAARLHPATSLRPHMYSTLFALLAATGLRISEALALRFEDVAEEGLIIRNTKFQKDRLVPLHETAVAGLGTYLARRRRLPTMDDHVFVSNKGRAINRQTVHPVFVRLLQSSGIKRAPGGHRPRIHDLRHTFAVRALEACPEGRDEVGQHMIALSTYMGHATIQSTYWYLQITPRLLRDISLACEALHEAEEA